MHTVHPKTLSGGHLADNRQTPYDDNDRKTVVVIGTTGTGKSTLGNVLLGLSANQAAQSHDVLGGAGLQPIARFATSSRMQSCTLECQALDGFWLGDSQRPVRIIDTPGHGDADGRDVEMRESIVRAMKAEKVVHAFIWAKNSAQPRFDKQDAEFFKIFTEMFGPGFTRNMIVVLTRFDHSESAQNRRKEAGTSLHQICADLRESIEDFDGEVPILAIDALYDKAHPHSKDKFQEGSEEAWTTIRKFAACPIEHIQNVKDDVSKLSEQIDQLQESNRQLEMETRWRAAEFEREQKRLRREMENQQKEKAAEVAKICNEMEREQKRLRREMENQQKEKAAEVAKIRNEMERKQERLRRDMENQQKEKSAAMEANLCKMQEEIEGKKNAEIERLTAVFKAQEKSMKNLLLEAERKNLEERKRAESEQNKIVANMEALSRKLEERQGTLQRQEEKPNAFSRFWGAVVDILANLWSRRWPVSQ